jgi:hypothetical protein
MLGVVSCSLSQASVSGRQSCFRDTLSFAPAGLVVGQLDARYCNGLPGSINHALRLLIASGASEFLSFVLESIIRGRRAPHKKHWLAAVRTARLIVHTKVSRIPQLVPHKPRPPEPDLNDNAIKRWKCVDSRTVQRRRSSATRSANLQSIWGQDQSSA